MQPSVGTGQEAVKESPFGAMIPPTAIPGFMAGVFNPVAVQTQQAVNEKSLQSADGMDAAAELTLQGEATLTCSCMKETNRFCFLVDNLVISCIVFSLLEYFYCGYKGCLCLAKMNFNISVIVSCPQACRMQSAVAWVSLACTPLRSPTSCTSLVWLGRECLA